MDFSGAFPETFREELRYTFIQAYRNAFNGANRNAFSKACVNAIEIWRNTFSQACRNAFNGAKRLRSTLSLIRRRIPAVAPALKPAPTPSMKSVVTLPAKPVVALTDTPAATALMGPTVTPHVNPALSPSGEVVTAFLPKSAISPLPGPVVASSSDSTKRLEAIAEARSWSGMPLQTMMIDWKIYVLPRCILVEGNSFVAR